MATSNDARGRADAARQEEPAKPAEVSAPEESRYETAEMIELADGMFGRPAHVVAGAISLLDKDRTAFTKAEVEAAIKKFDNHEPVVDRPDAGEAV